MRVLAIETSCDETAAAVVSGPPPVIESGVVASQIDLHKKFGGVFPELASRAHTETIIPVIEQALDDAKADMAKVEALAVTIGPGLIGSLLIGVNATKALSFAEGLPIIPVNHLEGHIYANFIEHPEAKFPILTLTVAGGHTLLVLMGGHLRYEVLGRTRDDSAGEAFDKVAKLLGLGYPGGPAIEKVAEGGDPAAFQFPRGMIAQGGYDFSFSGLKTAVLYKVHELTRGRVDERGTGHLVSSLSPSLIADLAASFQQAVVEVLVEKTMRAAVEYRPKSVFLAGGVAANTPLRETLADRVKKELPETLFAVPEFKYCTDNAAMIGAAAVYKLAAGKLATWESVQADPNIELSPEKRKRARLGS